MPKQKEKTMDDYIAEVSEKLGMVSKCPVAHIDYSGDGGPFGFHAVMINPKMAVLVSQAGVLVPKDKIKELDAAPTEYQVTSFSMENLFPVWKLEEPIGIGVVVSETAASLTDFDPWVEAFYEGDILSEWLVVDLLAEDFDHALDLVKALSLLG